MTLSGVGVDSLHLVESSVKNKGNDDGVRTWSTAVQILLSVAALAILWGRRGFLARFFLQFDKNCGSVLCPSFSKRQRLLKWASGRLPPTWSSYTNTLLGGPTEFWRDGSLLCTLINSAIPGACPNPHRHWRRPPSHGQALAYKYLGIAPIFNETEFSCAALSLKYERALFLYLLKIQEAITRISENDIRFSSRYAARGMGLSVGEQNRKTTFYIYSSSITSSSKHDVMVSIRGPYDSCSTVTVPFQNYYFQDRKRFGYQSKAQKLFYKPIAVDFVPTININQQQDVKNNIPIKLLAEKERVKVVYIPKNMGIYEISIITNGFHLLGSPFSVNVTDNSTSVIDTFNDNKSLQKKNRGKSLRRRVISKIIDFVDEKINYDSLKTLPLHIRSTPRIKVTESDYKTNEDFMLEDQSVTDQTVNSYADTNNNKITSLLNEFSDVDVEAKNVVCTSPICSDHIEEEVSIQANEPSEVPKRNFKKRPLRRHDQLEISTKVDASLNTKHAINEEVDEHIPLIFNKSDSLNILNFLTSLKVDEPKPNKTEIDTKQKLNQAHLDRFQERLNYWETQTDIADSNRRCNRCSLPNLFSSESKSTYDDSNYKLPNDPTFRERQQYWKSLSSQTASYSSITSSLLKLESTARFINTKNYNSRRSLPNLFSKGVREDTLNEIIYRNTTFPVDFFQSSDVLAFKARFKERKEFWERLSTQNLNFNDSFYNYIREDSASQENYEESNFDSGFYSSLPNIWQTNKNDDAPDNILIENPDSLKYKLQYEQRREYWESISCHTVSNGSLLEKIEPRYQTQNFVSKKTPVRMNVNVAHFKPMDKVQIDPGNRREINLTDDLKHINDQREKMKVQFQEAKQFFRHLEDAVK